MSNNNDSNNNNCNNNKQHNQSKSNRTFVHNLISGGIAGTCVDLSLYPLDTIKTRMQSQHGFFHSGGFNGLFKGVKSAAIGSAPSAALFFTSYEYTKQVISPYTVQHHQSISHCIAASVGEIVACLVRVPTDNIKQKLQVGYYRGYLTTLMREIPFSLIQFPLYEYGKQQLALYNNVIECKPYESALIGSLAGGLAAGLTTPIDVAKTRIMLNQTQLHTSNSIYNVLYDVYNNKGVTGLFAGIQPRVAWISIGGFVFFGAYETAQQLLYKVG